MGCMQRSGQSMQMQAEVEVRTGHRTGQDLHDTRVVNGGVQQPHELLERQRPIVLTLLPVLLERLASARRESETLELQLLARLLRRA